MRAVRQRCGFGCVICGCAIVQYHHFDPEYADAKEHSTLGITLLCGQCHDKATKGFIGTDQVREFDRDPLCKRSGFAHDIFFAPKDNFHFQIGGATFRRRAVVTYDGEPLIAFDPPSRQEEPWKLNAHLEDVDEVGILTIEDNIWKAGIHHFDVETTGNELIIRRKARDIVLRMRLEPGGWVIIEQLQMNYKGFNITTENGWFKVSKPNGGALNLKCPQVESTLKLFSNGSIAV